MSISQGAGSMMQRVPPAMQRRLQDMRDNRPDAQTMPPMLQKYQAGVFLQYSNASYLSERNLILIIIFLFIITFSVAFIMVLRLYRANQNLLIQTEHDKQLIQLGEAARTLAHEIRNPLGTLKIQRDLLFRKLPSEYAGNLQVIDRELKRLNVLVERVGDFLRNPLGRPEKIDLVLYVEELYGGRKDVLLNMPAENSMIFFDRDRLRTVLDNIVNNAIDSGGSAELSITNEGRKLRLSILDHGRGFSEEALQRLFDPFFSTKDSGTGLGLSVVKRLMDSAGGRIEVSNNKDGGALVMLVFGDSYESIDS
jgi:two-component system sensor histidine kinase HydH